MNNEQGTMNKEEARGIIKLVEHGGEEASEMKTDENRTCLDCLYCKVSVKSTKNCMLCFCEKTINKAKHKEPYWVKNHMCIQFEDMC